MYNWSLKAVLKGVSVFNVWKGSTAVLPVTPQETLNLRSEIALMFFTNSSLPAFQANAALGKYPHLLPLPKREDPSALMLAVNK
jgi:hypothetical protein